MNVEELLKKIDEDDQEFLEHYGVKGMKWGVRRSKKQLAKQAAESEDSKTARKLATQPKRNLTNKEIQTIVTRMNLERQLSQVNPSTYARGKKAVKEVVGLGKTANEVSKTLDGPAFNKDNK